MAYFRFAVLCGRKLYGVFVVFHDFYMEAIVRFLRTVDGFQTSGLGCSNRRIILPWINVWLSSLCRFRGLVGLDDRSCVFHSLAQFLLSWFTIFGPLGSYFISNEFSVRSRFLNEAFPHTRLHHLKQGQFPTALGIFFEVVCFFLFYDQHRVAPFSQNSLFLVNVSAFKIFVRFFENRGLKFILLMNLLEHYLDFLLAFTGTKLSIPKSISHFDRCLFFPLKQQFLGLQLELEQIRSLSLLLGQFSQHKLHEYLFQGILIWYRIRTLEQLLDFGDLSSVSLHDFFLNYRHTLMLRQLERNPRPLSLYLRSLFRNDFGHQMTHPELLVNIRLVILLLIIVFQPV